MTTDTFLSSISQNNPKVFLKFNYLNRIMTNMLIKNIKIKQMIQNYL